MTDLKMCGRCKVRPRKYQAPGSGGTYCVECIRESTKEYRLRNPERRAATNRAAHLRLRYGLTVEQYNEILEAQGGVCACCGGLPPANRALDVDHDHSCCPGRASCGKCIRALLCPDCNLLVGRVENGHLEKIFNYLAPKEVMA